MSDFQFSRVFDVKKYRGCYLLWKDGVVVYVGQSINIMSRIGAHLSKDVKDFDGYSFCVYDGDLNEAEAELIARYKPQLNKSMPSNENYESSLQIRKRLGVTGWAWKKIKRTLIPVWKDYYKLSEVEVMLNA